MNERNLHIIIDTKSNKSGEVSFLLLASILKGIQESLYYVAMSEQSKYFKERLRIPRDIQESCELVRLIEKPGSYEITAALPEPKQISFPGFKDVGLMAKDKFLRIIQSISSPSGSQELRQLVVDDRYLRYILKSIESYCPRFGQRWTLFIGGRDGEPHGHITKETRTSILRALESSIVEHSSIIGKLVRVHFDENRVGIYYAPTHRVLDCYYRPDVEDFIVGSLKELVRVSGFMQLDSKGCPDKIVDVDEIEGIDLDPITMDVLEADGVRITFNRSITIEPKIKDGFIFLEWPELNIFSSSSQSLDQALEEFQSDVAWLYKEYYMESNEGLSLDAIKLKQYLKQITKGVAND